MYGWGSEDVKKWNKPGAYNYDSAKAPYLESLKKEAEAKGPRTYLKKSKPNLEFVNPYGKDIVSESENLVILAVDGTGSFQTWPKEIHDRTPLFYQTLASYRSDLEVCLAVLGDAISDKWPLQVSPFGKGVVLDDYVNALFPEGAGGPGIRESYELFAYFANKHIKTTKAQKPFLIMMADEKFYDTVNPEQVQQHIGDGLQESLDSMAVWKELSGKFDIYLLRKPYPGHDEEIVKQWSAAIGEEKIIQLYDPLRVVDVAMGLIAKRWGYASDFKKNLSARQDSKGIASVEASLRAAPIVASPKSTSSTIKSGKSKNLMEG